MITGGNIAHMTEPQARAPYGYARRTDETGQPVLDIDPHGAEVIRAASRDILSKPAEPGADGDTDE